MFKTLSAIALATMLAAAVTLIPVLSPSVKASAPVPAGKSDRLETTTCDLRNWPYYDAACLRDVSHNAGRGQKVRIVSTDRIAPNTADLDAPASPYPPAWLAWLPEQLPVDEVAAAISPRR